MEENQPIISWQVMDRYLCYMQMANNDISAVEELHDIVHKLQYVALQFETTRIENSTLPDDVKSEISSKFQKEKEEIMRFCNYMEMELSNCKKDVYRNIPKLPLDVHDDEWVNSFLDEEE